MIHIWPDNIGYERMDTSYKACGENMLKEQKDWILEIVKKDYDKRDFKYNYLVSYKEFLDIDNAIENFD
ncbi:MAG: hypothetical protein IKK33_15305 [Lachnospiraceae bacterium]|nr:hypothetical protein [Lachnospiraceae bacterium]